jgi:hypothetical protein
MYWSAFEPQVKGAIIGVVGIALTVLANWLAVLAGRRHERTSVVTAIRSDVRSLVQALEMSRLVDSFVLTYQSPPEKAIFPPWSDSPRAEDYFKLYEALAPDIGKLSPDLARETVRFYTFFRISRDAAAPLGALKAKGVSTGEHCEHARNVLLALNEAFTAAEIVLAAEYGPSGRRDDGVREASAMRAQIDRVLNVRRQHELPGNTEGRFDR